MTDPTLSARLKLLEQAAEGAGQQFIEMAQGIERIEGASGSAVETAVFFSCVNAAIEPANDPTWLDQRLAAIEYRGGPRDKMDEAYLALNTLSPTQLAAILKIIRSKQLQVARQFFYIHSGATSVDFPPIPNIRFTIHHGLHDADFQPSTDIEFPNALDEMFHSYISELNE